MVCLPLRFKAIVGCGPKRRPQAPHSTSPAPSSARPTERLRAATINAITPPAKPITTSARINCDGPIQAPMAAHNLTSPIPIPRIHHNTPVSAAPSAKPAKLCPSPDKPRVTNASTTPASEYGTTSQFGIRRVRMSQTTAISSTRTVGHHAGEFTESSWCKSRAWSPPT